MTCYGGLIDLTRYWMQLSIRLSTYCGQYDMYRIPHDYVAHVEHFVVTAQLCWYDHKHAT